MLKVDPYKFRGSLIKALGNQELRQEIENGVGLGAPDGILFNGLGPYRYDNAVVSGSIAYQTVNVEPGYYILLFHWGFTCLVSVHRRI